MAKSMAGATALYSGQTLTGGAGPTTSAWQDVSGNYETTVLIKVTNGATAPSTPGNVQVQLSHDNSEDYDNGGSLAMPDGNSEEASWTVHIEGGVNDFRVVATHGDDQDVTLDVDYDGVTG